MPNRTIVLGMQIDTDSMFPSEGYFNGWMHPRRGMDESEIEQGSSTHRRESRPILLGSAHSNLTGRRILLERLNRVFVPFAYSFQS